ncbi:MAG: NADH-quinone oxidoreductase subunit M [Armatimonadetes bacterium]|nr:NADH-quinone oxidoreductase subunit M [Armatimonadota bacterium]
MNEPNGFGILTLLTFLPLIGALIMMAMSDKNAKALKYFALLVTAATFGVSIKVLLEFKVGSFHFQLTEFVKWIDSLGIHYRMGVDGISIWLVVLTTLLSFLSVWFSFYVSKRVKQYLIAMLILETAMLGVFLSLDLILFYTFFEASLVPMWLLISIWGGERRIYAGLKFFLFTFAGSIFMLIGMIALYLLQRDHAGINSFSLLDIQQNVANGRIWAGALAIQPWIFWSFAVAFLVKCPAFPFHVWLPDAHVEAPTAGSIILAGVLLKMGTYGFLRFVIPLFPDVLPQMVPYIMTLAVIGIIYGAIVSAVQPDVKKLVAYSSVSHMGFVLLGIFSLTHSGMMGGSMQQLNHGISTGALFLLVGLIYERRHTRLFSEFGGLKAQMPIYAAIFLIVMLSSVGLPGTNGFIGEILAMYGAFEACFFGQFGLSLPYAVIAGTGVILAAVYLLWMFQKTFYGRVENPANKKLKDIKPWEIALCAPFVILIFWCGFFPTSVLKPMEASIAATRMMALNVPGERPVWNETDKDIDDKGNLRKVTYDYKGEPTWGKIIAVGKYHFGNEDRPGTGENQPGKIEGEGTAPQGEIHAQSGIGGSQ